MPTAVILPVRAMPADVPIPMMSVAFNPFLVLHLKVMGAVLQRVQLQLQSMFRCIILVCVCFCLALQSLCFNLFLCLGDLALPVSFLSLLLCLGILVLGDSRPWSW